MNRRDWRRRTTYVPRHLTADELTKAAGNLQRVEGYFSARTHWQLQREGFESLQSAIRATRAMIGVLDPLVESEAIVVDRQGGSLTDQIPADELDSTALAKLASFMVELTAWFEGRAGDGLAPGTNDQLGDVYGSLLNIQSAVESILESSPFEDLAAAEQVQMHEETGFEQVETSSLQAPAAIQVDHTGAVGAPMAMPPPRSSVAQPGRLVLDNTVQNPLLKASRDELELTPAAKQLVSEFLTEHGVEYAEHQLHRFQAEVRRRIERTPDGQVLVVKIGDLDGGPSPFFSYQPRTQTPPG
jgi:hypothetical protein